MPVEANSATVFGLEMDSLAEREVPLEAIVLLKVLDEECQPGMVIRSTEGLTAWERVGILTLALDYAREEAQNGWTKEGDDDEED